MSVEERVANLEQAFLALNRLAKRTDERHESTSESIRLLTQLLQRHEESFEDVRAEQSNADSRIAALADAQIKTEDALNRLAQAQERIVESQEFLNARLGETDKRLNDLITLFVRHTNDNHGGR